MSDRLPSGLGCRQTGTQTSGCWKPCGAWGMSVWGSREQTCREAVGPGVQEVTKDHSACSEGTSDGALPGRRLSPGAGKGSGFSGSSWVRLEGRSGTCALLTTPRSLYLIPLAMGRQGDTVGLTSRLWLLCGVAGPRCGPGSC